MTLIKTLKPRLAKTEVVESLIAPPYDIVDHQQAQNYINNKPDSIMNVTRADGLFDTTNNILAKDIYQAAVNALAEKKNRLYNSQSQTCFIIYQIKSSFGCQTGLLCLANTKYLITHELTRPSKVEDRINLSSALNCQISPVMLCTSSKDKFAAYLEPCAASARSLYEVNYNDEQHRLFLVENVNDIKKLQLFFNEKASIYIADGHHRSQTQLELNNRQPSKFSPYILSVIFPGEELNILGYHRLVKMPSSLSIEQFWQELKTHYDVKPVNEALLPQDKNTFGCYINQQWYCLSYKKQNNNRLAIEILHQTLIEPLFNVLDPRVDKNIEFIGGVNATKQLENKIKLYDNNWLGFTIAPTTVDEIISTADHKKIMPPKSTYFEPKLLDGFILQDEIMPEQGMLNSDV